VGPRAVLDAVVKRKIPSLLQKHVVTGLSEFFSLQNIILVLEFAQLSVTGTTLTH
jgi:hypothetical protein